MPIFEAGVPISSLPVGVGQTFTVPQSNGALTPLPSAPSGADGGVGIAAAGEAGSIPTAIRLVTGTAGDDLIPMAGGFALGGEGADSFLLTPISSQFQAPTDFGVILDFQAADKLDLSALGVGAKILGSEAFQAGSGQRISIDFDGDGVEDGFVVAHTPPAAGAPVETPNAFVWDGPAVSGLSALPPETGFQVAVTVDGEGQPVAAVSGQGLFTFGSLLPADAVPSAVGSYEVREATAEDAFVSPTLATFSADWIVT